jgi:hypothetical protein
VLLPTAIGYANHVDLFAVVEMPRIGKTAAQGYTRRFGLPEGARTTAAESYVHG